MESLFRQETVITFILVLSRVSGFMAAAPILGAKTMPRKLKVLLAFFLSVLVFIAMPKAGGAPHSLPALALMIAGQVFIGFLMGSVVSFVFAAIQAGGALMDLQVGYSMSSLVDPQSGVMATVLARWHYMLATMIFLGLDGHHWLVLGLVNSFKIQPLTDATISSGFSYFAIRTFSNILKIAFNSAIPVLIAVILVDVTAGFIARTAPKLNILIISFPFKIFLGLTVMAAAFGGTVYMIAKWLGDLQYPLLRAFYL